jgi:uncharacterized protein
MDENIARSKKEILVNLIKDSSPLLVAFSGGVDSSFLLALGHEILGDRLTAVTARSIIHPSREQEEAAEFTRLRGIKHIIFESDEITRPEFLSNSPDRCYHCKRSLAQRLIEIARKLDIVYIAHAANFDDLSDYRPGMKAAQEMGIISPLVDSRLKKDEIRLLSKEMGLKTWDKPSMACLASRIPYGESISPEKLRMVEDGEEFLAECGFKQHRVRYHGSVARIEVEQMELRRIIENELRQKILKRFREIGFTHISVDLEGYVSGSMNRELEKRHPWI